MKKVKIVRSKKTTKKAVAKKRVLSPARKSTATKKAATKKSTTNKAAAKKKPLKKVAKPATNKRASRASKLAPAKSRARTTKARAKTTKRVMSKKTSARKAVTKSPKLKKKAIVKKAATKKAGVKKTEIKRVSQRTAPLPKKKTLSPKKAVTKRAPSLKSLKTKTKTKAKTKTKTKAKTPKTIRQIEDLSELLKKLSEQSETLEQPEATKFDIGVKHDGIAVSEQELPLEYGIDRAILLVVDPRFVFTYWEVKTDAMQKALHQAGPEAKLTLRFYDITDSGIPEQSSSWDVEVFDRLGNWYLKLDRPEQKLCFDIGMKSPTGIFYTIVRSNQMRLPPQSLAKPGPIKWMVVSPAGDKLLSDIEEYTDADLTLLKKILGPYFFDLLMRGRLATIAGSSVEAVFYDVQMLKMGETSAGESPGSSPWSAVR